MTIGYTRNTGLVMVAVVALGMLYACTEGYNAKADDIKAVEDLRYELAVTSAMKKLEQPIKCSLPEHYLEMTGEKQ